PPTSPPGRRGARPRRAPARASGPVRKSRVESGGAIVGPAKDTGRAQWQRHGPDRGRTQGRRAPAGSAWDLRTGPLQLEELRRVEEGPDLLGRLLLARLERLAVTVDPDHRHLLLHARLDVVEVARRDVHPALLAADAARR